MIVRQDNTGLGIQTWEAYRHLQPERTLVIDFSAQKPGPQFPERYHTGTIMRVMGLPTPQEVDVFLRDIDVLFTCETAYTYHLMTVAKERGIKLVIQPNYEFFAWKTNKLLPLPDLFVIPSLWHINDYIGPRRLLQVPIATEHFTPVNSTRVSRILHVAGKPAANDRNGTFDFLKAIPLIHNKIEITITTQADRYFDDMLKHIKLPSHITLHLDTTTPPHYWDLYTGYDLLVMPRRYGGLCLPVNEAIGAGMPVVMPAIDPNTTWLPSDWLVPAIKQGSFAPRLSGPEVDIYEVNPVLLAAKIDEFIEDTVFYQESQRVARVIRDDYSWKTMLPLYKEVLQ